MEATLKGLSYNEILDLRYALGFTAQRLREMGMGEQAKYYEALKERIRASIF